MRFTLAHSAIMAMGSVALIVGVDKWSKLFTEYIDALYPNLSTYVILALIMGMIIVGIYRHIKDGNSESKSKRETHSKKLVNTFTILSDGHYEYYSSKANFVIPYPYSEYEKYEKRTFYPTKSDKEEEDKFDFVSIRESNEGEFKQALDHLKSYKDIVKMFDEAKQAEIEIHDFLKKNKIAVQEMTQFFINSNNHPSRSQPKKEIIERLYPEYEKLRKNGADSLSALQKSLKIIAQQLDDGTIIKGKCELGY